MKDIKKYFEGIDCVIVPGGFDNRGVEGKIKAIQYTREQKIPFLGICLGLQCAVIEFARNVLGIANANSQEFNKDSTHVVHYIEGQQNVKRKSGTLRLGAFDCELDKDSLAFKAYGKKVISERHRHRYEVNSEFSESFSKSGFKISGKTPQTGLIELMELDTKQHPFFVGIQAHPEFKSRLGNPSPLFNELLRVTISRKGIKHDAITSQKEVSR